MITRSDIDELVAFLPKLLALDGKFIESWGGGQKNSDGVLTMPWPNYAPVVEEFFRTAGKKCWCDYGYRPDEASQMLGDSERIENASLSEIKTMLTWCVRGERFCDGHWGAVLSDGKVFALLERLRRITESYGQ